MPWNIQGQIQVIKKVIYNEKSHFRWISPCLGFWDFLGWDFWFQHSALPTTARNICLYKNPREWNEHLKFDEHIRYTTLPSWKITFVGKKSVSLWKRHLFDCMCLLFYKEKIIDLFLHFSKIKMTNCIPEKVYWRLQFHALLVRGQGRSFCFLFIIRFNI